jgi:hypothetical protein
VSDEPKQHLSREQLQALKFAAHRQLTRWARRRDLKPRQQAQRAALICALDILEDTAFEAAASYAASPAKTPG